MSAISLIMKLDLGEKDYEVIEQIKLLMNECDDIDHKKQNNEDNKEENIITENKDENLIYDLMNNSNFQEYLNMIYNRGPDNFEVFSVNKENDIIESMNDIEKMKYKEIFDYVNNTNNKIIINSYLNLFNNHSTNKIILKDSETKNIFQFIGEIYNNIKEANNNESSINEKDDKREMLFKLLNKFSCENKIDDINKYISKFFEIYNNLESDHSFYFHDNINKQILISRDIFGKRSIIFYYIQPLSIAIFTPALSETLINIYKSNQNKIFILEIPSNHLLIINEKNPINKLSLHSNPITPKPHLLRFNPAFDKINTYENILQNCHDKLRQSIRKRINDIINYTNNNNGEYTLGISFSGGLDSTLMTYYTLLETNHIDNNKINIDLFNLSFDKSSPDRMTGIISYKELIDKFPNRKINLVLIDKEYNTDITPDFQKKILNLIFPRNTHMDFNISSAKYLSTNKKGYLVDKIKLIKYFETSEIINENLITKSEEKTYQNNIMTKKIINFEYEKFTIMDKIYTSQAKIILDGLGADEIFGGYLRYKNGDIEAQMKKDLDRLWLRNCGRDERVCGENLVELRFPYLDNDLMKFLGCIEDMKQIVDFDKPRGEGEKYLLRKVAKDLVGFKLSHKFEKRAIQFGTKIAHQTNIHKYGSNNKANGKAQFDEIK